MCEIGVNHRNLDLASGNTAPEAACGTFVLESRHRWDNLPVGIKPLFSLWAAQMERERKMCFSGVMCHSFCPGQ